MVVASAGFEVIVLFPLELGMSEFAVLPIDAAEFAASEGLEIPVSPELAAFPLSDSDSGPFSVAGRTVRFAVSSVECWDAVPDEEELGLIPLGTDEAAVPVVAAESDPVMEELDFGEVDELLEMPPDPAVSVEDPTVPERASVVSRFELL